MAGVVLILLLMALDRMLLALLLLNLMVLLKLLIMLRIQEFIGELFQK
jgi:hypothetical protein